MESDVYYMLNQLKRVARQKGFSGRHISSELGLTPETVSRHMNGRTQMSVEDAQRYSELLSVPPEQILFPPVGIQVVGTLLMNCVRMNTVETGIPQLTGPFSFNQSTAPIVCKTEKSYNTNNIYTFSFLPMRERKVDRDAINSLSVFSATFNKSPQVFVGYLHQQAQNKKNVSKELYCFRSIENAEIVENLDLSWASPIDNIYLQSEKNGLEIDLID